MIPRMRDVTNILTINMIIKCYNEGTTVDLTELISQGFNLENNDYKEENNKKFGKLKFTGFITNNNDDTIVVFPKNYPYSWGNIEYDISLLFKTFITGSELGSRRDSIQKFDRNNFESNYPFEYFFKIYDYFKRYGLDFKKVTYQTPSHQTKINWKYTIKHAQKLLVNNQLILYPFYYDKTLNNNTFLADCTVFAIDYTINKFPFVINLDSTNKTFPQYILEMNTNDILDRLEEIRERTFKDHLLNLIEYLMNFFSKFKVKGHLYLKQYKFSSIWEKMVEKYLNNYFSEIDVSGTIPKIIYHKERHDNTNLFSKKSFPINLSKPQNSIEVDHYASNNSYQLLFDSKYYQSIHELNYKQLSYHVLLKDMLIPEFNFVNNHFPNPLPKIINDYTLKMNKKISNDEEYLETVKELFTEGIITPKFNFTLSALFLPSKNRSSKIHFRGTPNLSPNLSEVIILEEYLEIKTVMENFIQ